MDEPSLPMRRSTTGFRVPERLEVTVLAVAAGGILKALPETLYSRTASSSELVTKEETELRRWPPAAG